MGLNFVYYQTGNGEHDLFIQHGYSDSSLCWGNLPKHLGQHYRLTLMDARGHGLSSKPDNGYDLTTMAGDIIALIKFLGLNKPVIIGHSMGGSLAAHVAALEPDFPAGVILIDPSFRFHSKIAQESVIFERLKEMKAIKKMSKNEIVASICAKHPNWPETFIEPVAEAKLQMSLEVINIFRSIDVHWEDDLKKAKCPILLITADVSAGAIVSKEIVEFITLNHPNVKIVHITGAGHSIHREKYQELLITTENFLNEIF